MFHCTKTYGHEEGLSCVFRQWRAASHCRFLHGYALKVRLEFAASVLDKNGWVVDFGGLKPIKEWLHQTFDHSVLVARDDPYKERLMDLPYIDMSKTIVLSNVGCEAFAHHIGLHVQQWLNDDPRNADFNRTVWLVSCEVAEHGGNSAIWIQE